MTDRISCCIPGCRRTFKRDTPDSIIMCGRHWRMGDEAMRNRHKQLRKRVRWFARRWHYRQRKIEASPQLYDKFHDAWYRAGVAANAMWHRVQEDVTIKAAFAAEDAPRRRARNAA
jgi:hypothetical protein